MTKETVGARLRRVREAQGLSQRELSGPGISYPYISRIEAGSRRPSLKALRSLAGKLGVTAEYLETGVEETASDRLLRDLVTMTGVRVFAVEFVGGDVQVEWGDNILQGATLTEALQLIFDIEREAQSLHEDEERIREARQKLEERRANGRRG